ncbi:MAG: RluA family pseudouridine synthase [Planctomycetota bacterium]
MPKYSIVFEDDYLLVVDKPSGLLVIPTPKGETNTLTDLLNEYLQAKSPNSPKSHPCHRLDRETSGLILYAKGKAMQQKVMNQFHRKEVGKKYLAFVQGHPKKETGLINYKLEGNEAATQYRVVKYYGSRYTLVEAEPLTGRTNQIRLHFKMIGHPVVGERKFAFARDFAVKARRLMLHSSFISFTHPATNQQMSFSSNLPTDMIIL